MATLQINNYRHLCTNEQCGECQQRPLKDEELQYAEQHWAQCGRHCDAKLKPLIGRLVAACGKGLLLNCHSLRPAYAQVPPQAPKSGKPSSGGYEHWWFQYYTCGRIGLTKRDCDILGAPESQLCPCSQLDVLPSSGVEH